MDGHEVFDEMSNEAKDLIHSLLCLDKNDRIKIRDARKHSWLEGHHPVQKFSMQSIQSIQDLDAIKLSAEKPRKTNMMKFI